MPKSPSNQPVVLPIIGAIITNAKHAAVLLLGLALIAGPPQIVFGQSSQQQEQQRQQQERDQQQRDQQQREQQQREQQQRDQQQREEQARDQQQREQQQREQQQREQQERDQQQREQQQREQQARDQQQRDQQQRDQQQREQQERLQQQQHTFSDSAAPTSNATSEASHATVQPAAGAERRIDSAPAANAKEIKDHASSPAGPDSRRSLCEDGACKTPAPKPVQLQPVASDLEGNCKNGPCQPCPVGQSAGKNGSCVAVPSVRTAAPPPAARTVVQQPCAAGQVWNGIQCQIIGAQQCLPGQSRVGAICQDCAISTGSALGIIERVRSARQSKDQICLKNSTGMECQQAEADYDLTLSEYRSFLAGVPMECQMGLPDPIAI